MKKKLPFLAVTTFLVTMLASCATTSIMESGFQKIDNDTYELKVGTGGPIFFQAVAAKKAAKSRLIEETNQFIAKNKQYSSYKIITTERSIIPMTYYKYIVEFE